MRTVRGELNITQIHAHLDGFEQKLKSIMYWIDTDHGFELIRKALIGEACGDFQGAHRLMWERVNGYIEAKEIFHVDSALGWDMTGFLTPPLVRVLPGENHLSHKKISMNTPHLPISTKRNRGFVYAHLPTRFLYPRKACESEWGRRFCV
jgi:hypothetical protein